MRRLVILVLGAGMAMFFACDDDEAADIYHSCERDEDCRLGLSCEESQWSGTQVGKFCTMRCSAPPSPSHGTGTCTYDDDDNRCWPYCCQLNEEDADGDYHGICFPHT
ncbi:hypothetical protein ACFL51_00620 [Myxococcota bacterium]